MARTADGVIFSEILSAADAGRVANALHSRQEDAMEYCKET
jgi:hypothetical protein